MCLSKKKQMRRWHDTFKIKKKKIMHCTWFKNRHMLMLPGSCLCSVNFAAYSALIDVSLYRGNEQLGLAAA